MTYFNGNPYHGEITEVAHDDCLPEDQIDTVTMSNGDVHRQQKLPWHWSPIYGKPLPCKYCGEAVR
jgi:hypothetical protein